MSIAACFHLAAFHHLFRVVHANTAELRNVCYRLRHKVYCEEFGFEPVRSDGLERDEWDSASIHCLVQNALNGEYVACARLIVPPFRYPGMTLPFERLCSDEVVGSVLDSGASPSSIAEVSRLAIRADYRGASSRRGAGRRATLDSTRGAQSPPLLAGLLIGLLALSRIRDIDSTFMLVEARLARYLTTIMGFRPKIVGEPVEHHGRRVLAMLNVPEAVEGLSPLTRPVFEDISVSLQEEDAAREPAQLGNRAVTPVPRPAGFAY